MNFKRGALKTVINRKLSSDKNLYVYGQKQHKTDRRKVVASTELIQSVQEFLRVSGPEPLAEHTNLRPVQIKRLASGKVSNLTWHNLNAVEQALKL